MKLEIIAINRLHWPLNKLLRLWAGIRRGNFLSLPSVSPSGRKSGLLHRKKTLRESAGEYVPKAGMRGRNVQWVPCSTVVLDKMLDMAKVTPNDYVIDPGSGDGRIVIQVAKRGARAHGIEFNPKLVKTSEENADREGVGHRATFSVGDFFDIDFSRATVVTLFLRKDLNIALRPRILDLKPGTRVVSNIFDMGDWKADETVKVEDGDYYFRNHTARLWIVPAKVEGIWKLPSGELSISQKFQIITGALITGKKTVSVKGKITGDRIDFTADGRQYTGRVTENRMDLEANNGSKIRWVATFERTRVHGFEDSRGQVENKKTD